MPSPVTLPPEVRDLLSRPILGWATVVRPDGTLHSTVVWLDVDGDDVVFNTAVGRAKDRFLRGNPEVSLSVLDPENGFHFASVSGRGELQTEGADAVIDALAKKYMGVDSYPFRRDDEVRVTVRVAPTHVIYNAG